MLKHLENLAEPFGKLLTISDLSIEVYGSPSAELAKASEGLDVEVFSFYKGQLKHVSR